MQYWLIVLSLFLIFYAGFNRPFVQSFALGVSVAFLLLTFIPSNNYAPKEKKQTKEIWI